jgi:hypothetical protein
MVFIETSVFTREIRTLLPDEDYRRLQAALIYRPGAGDLIPGGGGLRKIRWGMRGMGKRGALRIIYHWDVPDTIYMRLPYSKSDQDNLTQEQRKFLRNMVKEWLA